MTTEERLTRLEDAVGDLALMLSDGDPYKHRAHVNRTASDAAVRFLDTIAAIQAERPPSA
jgi:hypothetical protein